MFLRRIVLRFALIQGFFPGIGPGIFAQYCIPSSSFGPVEGRFIEAIELGDINHSFDDPAKDFNYVLYTQTTGLVPGNTYQLKITRGSSYSSMYYYAWIDYNQDGDFTDSGEKLGSYLANSSITTNTISFSVPQTAGEGTTRLRVSCAYAKSSLGPCESYDYGETEDCNVAIGRFEIQDPEIPWGYSVASADLDGDGLEDLIVSGNDRWNDVDSEIRVYRNAGNGNFIMEWSEYKGPEEAEINVCDFDNDNDIDFIVSGVLWEVFMQRYAGSYLYRNDGGFNFSSVDNTVFPNYIRNIYRWVDYDNDGDNDLFEKRVEGDVQSATLYINENGNFSASGETFDGITNGDAVWADYDSDGDIDLLTNGEDAQIRRKLRIFKNNEGMFVPLDIAFLDEKSTQMDWADYDQDGDLDFFCTGLNYFLIFRNEGGDQFSKIDPAIDYIDIGEAKWGDFDLDGDQDILLCGIRGNPDDFNADTERTSAIYEQVSPGVFGILNLPNNLYFVGGADWIDFDNDTDLDIAISYLSDTKILKNTRSGANGKPATPSGLAAKQEGNGLVFQWNPSTDDVTPPSGIQYNLSIRNQLGSNYILSPLSNPVSGARFVRKGGNTGFRTGKKITEIPPARYYWSVQAMDNSGLASGFASERYVDVLPFLTERFIDNSAVGGSFRNGGYVGCWGDYDNDGYLDFFGKGGVYRNNSGNGFSRVQSIWTSDEISHAQWVDFDNDGDLDLIYTYFADIVEVGMIFPGDLIILKNEGNTLQPYNTLDEVGPYRGNFVCRDFNSDGRKDLLVSGLIKSYEETMVGITNLYLNSEDGLTIAPFPVEPENTGVIPSGGYGYVYSEDLDSDSDYDVIFRDYWGGSVTAINNGSGVFTLQDRGIGTSGEEYMFADYDNDSDIDILVGASILRNSDSYFGNVNADLNPLSLTITYRNWLDMDGDNDLDILELGRDGDFNYRLVDVRNIGNDQFRTDEINDIPFGYGYMKMGDYDNDGDHDLLFSGALNQAKAVGVYRNNYNELGSIPGKPLNLESNLEGFEVVLTWDGPDGGGGEMGYSFDLKVGSSPGGCDIVAPDSNPNTGYIRTTHLGNTSINREWRLKDLPNGTYYWSVQAINQGYQTSGWAPQGSFIIADVRPNFAADTVCEGIATTFSDLSVTTDVISSYYWDFGDGSRSSEKEPEYSFQTAGVHQVTLTAYTQSGDEASVTKKVQVMKSPVVDFAANPVCDRAEMTYTDLTDIEGLSGINYTWYFGDGSISKDASEISHLFPSPGTYVTSLTVFASNGCSGQKIKEVTVAESPDAGISLAQGHYSAFCNGDSTILEVPGGVGYSFQWQFNGADLIGETDSELIVYGPTG
ncbi:MAG: FG-GAP-like repeat-containing protein, partial [Bacteroidota bacterium]